MRINGIARFLGIAGLAGMMVLGCETAEVESPAAGRKGTEGPVPNAFDSEIHALKAGIKDRALLEKEIRAAVLRHGYDLPPEDAFLPTGESQGTEALEKAGATTRSYLVKDLTGNTVTTYRTSMTVGVDEKITVKTVRSGSTDPVLVAYYTVDEETDERAIKIVDFGDDLLLPTGIVSLDAVLGWTNTTGKTQTLEIIVFAHSSSTRGTARLILSNITKNISETIRDIAVGGKVYSDKNKNPTIPSDCAMPPKSSITSGRITNVPETGSSGYYSDVLVVPYFNKLPADGAWFRARETSRSVETGWVKVSSGLDSSFFTLIYKPSSTLFTSQAEFHVTQKDVYSCDN